MLVTQNNVEAAFKGLRAIFMQKLASMTANPWQKIATRMESTGDEEDYDFLLALGGLKELLGEITVENLRAAGFTIKNKDFHKTIGVPVRTIRHDKLGLLKPAIELMAVRASQHPLKLVTQLLGQGFATKDYCNSFFFAAAKKEYTGASAFTNLVTGALSAGNYEDARARLRAMKDDKGESLELGDSVALVVPPELEAEGRRIVIADTGANGASNVNKGTAELVVLPGLSSYSTTAWYLADNSLPVKPLIVQIDYEPLQNQVTDPNDSHVVKHQEFIYQVIAGMNAGYAAPRLIIGSTGAGEESSSSE